MDRWPMLGRLKRAVKKVRFLLGFNVNRWRLASAIRTRRRRLSFNDRPGLMGCTEEGDSEDAAGSNQGLQRTMSCVAAGGEEDVDKRAEVFISNFYRQLRMERQVFLELRYYSRGDSFSSLSP